MSKTFATFTLNRSFSCAPDQLWFLLTDPKKRELWGAPSDDHVLHLDRANLSEGGTDLHRCGPKEAPDYTVETRWYRLDGPNTACFTETVIADGTKIATSLCNYALSNAQDGTILEVDVAVSSFVGPEALDDFQDGWTAGLNRLEKMMARLLA